MSITPSQRLRGLMFLPAVFLAGTFAASAQMVDLNGNGMSDIWEWIYGGGTISPIGDADGDGASNFQESIAGTNPFDSNSVPRIGVSAVAGTNFSITFAAALGKQYQLQSIQPSGPGGWSNWTTEASIIARSGSNVTFLSPASLAPKFFRIAIADVDTDGDGVNDWEEYQLGLDPLNPTSNGTLDFNGQPLTDYAYVVARLASQNVFTITATDPTANQPDSGQSPINLGLFTITRGGFPLNDVTVNLALGGPGPGFATEGVDHSPLPRSLDFPAGTSSQTITLNPLANPNLTGPVIAMLKLQADSGYKLGTSSNASIQIFPSATPTGTGLTANYYTNSSSVYSSPANFNPIFLKLTTTDPVIDFNWSNSTIVPITNTAGYYSVRWTGQVQPEYSETYYFDANTDDGVKLWVNDQLVIDHWVLQGATDTIMPIALQAGVRYDIRMDYFNGGGNGVAHLSWYSASQSKEIIPSNRLYPSSVPAAPTAVISPAVAYAFLNQPFSFTVSGANLANAYTAAGLPPGLTFNSSSGLISGTPTLAGDFQVTLTASNAVGLTAAVLDLQVIDTGSSVVREVWLGVPGTNVSDIPVTTPATSTSFLGTLEGITGYSNNYGERIRGYFTAPVTGNFYFWIAGSDSAELWISNDSEPVNKVRRAYVSSANPTGSRQWFVQNNQQSGWLSLVAGQEYYLEILHKVGAGGGTTDNWAVGWLQDPTGTNNAVSGVVPGYVLSRYFTPPVASTPGVLYTASLLPDPGNGSTGSGLATMRVSPDYSQVSIKFSYTGLSSPLTQVHLHADPYLGHPNTLLFDIVPGQTPQQADGSYVWSIVNSGTLLVADIQEIIKEGMSYLDIHTTIHPNEPGEVDGNFVASDGSPSFSPPPPAPAWTDDHSSANAASRFLIQTTYGPTPADVALVQSLGYSGWLSNQFSIPSTHHLPYVLANQSTDPTTSFPSQLTFNSWWQQSVTAPDQLRQRVAFALSEIMVVSQNGTLNNNAPALSAYYDTLLDNTFGNFRNLLEAVTLSPAMGLYLDMRGNDKGSPITGLHANENYAREVQQLFSIGLNRLWPDGTLVMDSQGNLVPTYNQNVVMGFAGVFTGWNYHQNNLANGNPPTNFYPPSDYVDPMTLVPGHHELGTKLLLDNVTLPPAWGLQTTTTASNCVAYCQHDLEAAHDSIFNNQNVGPFICRQLIQRLVTSNPSRGYLYRVVQAFNDNGAGVRGDMMAVLNAVFLDYEARSAAMLTQPTYGKQREPVLRVTAPARAFMAPPSLGGTYAENGTQVISITTTNAHRLSGSTTVYLSFTDASGNPAPPSQIYSVSVTGPTTLTVNAPGLLSGTYSQTTNSASTNSIGIMTVTVSNHGVAPGYPVYLAFTTGGATNGVYTVITNIDTSHFTVATSDPSTLSGNVLLAKLSVGGYTQSGTNITIDVNGPHWLNPGDSVYINFSSGTAVDGLYQVISVPDPTHFVVGSSASASQSQNSLSVYPLSVPPLIRSGNVVVSWSTWNVGFTDTGTPNLDQSPLNSPTVFNFYYPNFQFPGTLAAAGLTTPEFQLTSDTSVAQQMNFLYDGLLGSNSGNTNGLSSFNNGSGAIAMDLGPWMTQSYTSNGGVPSLVDALNSLLLGGQLSGTARTFMINYVANTTNFPYSSPPTDSQMRDRVRAVVHLIITSPDFTIQK